jgi:hypothetical protein
MLILCFLGRLSISSAAVGRDAPVGVTASAAVTFDAAYASRCVQIVRGQ